MEKFPSFVGDIMSSPVVTVEGDFNIRDTSKLMTEKRIGSIVIIDEERLVGIVTKTDIIKRVVSLGKDPRLTKVKDIMSSPVETISKDTGILAAMRMMRDKGITQLVVMDGDRIEGVVSERDAINAVLLASLSSFSSLMRKRVVY